MSEAPAGTFLPDTSAIVPALCPWHEHHGVALAELERRLGRGEEMIVAAPALIEAYAVLTRLPSAYRVSAEDAWRMLEVGFISDRRVVALAAAGYIALLRGASSSGVAGGRTYDAVIAACARQARVRTVLTYNAAHFRALVGEDIEVLVPGAAD